MVDFCACRFLGRSYLATPNDNDITIKQVAIPHAITTDPDRISIVAGRFVVPSVEGHCRMLVYLEAMR